ncbi:5-formyltetrahydrofolate cyclo-ligase [Salipaludibacillus neizhouensis]|uniref:5-formyltetrahydrofolate cyclo-ligase n=1 Tax=Salipaludibacillus neizhouensis TaxID=885475 RepID=A0A3A9KGM3_9BACI|nr:5-formyltetrahydrofolate cyclo-ligase [Salipaludibacillus neizhouensis]RKL68723.1 5-formyltetrahydrofolate cyclo-ligase [Salipaludibacillus neizhouensis]
MKENLRENTKKELSLHSPEIRTKELTEIYRQLYQLVDWKSSEIIAVTIAVGIELDTMPLIKQAWKQGKKIAVPRCSPKDKKLDFYYLENVNQLETSFYGLKEPDPHKCEYVDMKDIDLMIVPGIVFDDRGYRIGHGGGYYDRMLADYLFHTVSICFDFQIKGKLPVESHDIPVNKIVTPSKVISNVNDTYL